MLSVGTPMILMGDEVRRTQAGNNNAYCQDNEMSWFDWDLVKENNDLLRFVKLLINYRKKRDPSHKDYGMTLSQLLGKGTLTWHGVKLFRPDWSFESHSIAFTVVSLSGRMGMHIMINAYFGTLEFEIPEYIDDRRLSWKRWIDTSFESPDDIMDIEGANRVTERIYRLAPYSLAVIADTGE
jgi:isoamylase